MTLQASALTKQLILVQANGRDPEVLLETRQSGSSAVSVMRARFHGGARMSGSFDDIRISINLRGSSSRPCEWRASGRPYSHFAQNNAIYICPAEVEYAAATDADADILSISIPRERVALAIGATQTPGSHVIPRLGVTDPVLVQLGQLLAQELSGGCANGLLHWQDLSDRIVAHLVEHHLSSTYRPAGGVLTHKALKRVNGLIEGHLAEALSLDDLAEAAGQSRFHFERTFTQHMGITPYRYLMHRRLEAAIALVRRGQLPLKTIAAETGFADQSHLSRWSKAVRGLRLTQYRKN
jgi:AraC family transcriptional regulator